jgi:hypothetical protein
VQKTAGIPNGMRTATVVAVSGSKITISLTGGQFSSGVGVITSYAPRVGDSVAVFRQDSSWLILGPASPVNGWQAMKDLGYQNGWSDQAPGSAPIGQYRVTALDVKLVGQLTIGTTPGSGQVIVSGLPATPGDTVMVAAMTAVKVRIWVDSGGSLRIADATASGTLQFCCAYPLDARLI